MAEKGFGVKEINLIGASGTPTIESPNNLNLNAVNVAISTNATIGGDLTVTGNIGMGNGGNYHQGYISNLQIYKKELSQAEVIHNFDAMKGRFEQRPLILSGISYSFT